MNTRDLDRIRFVTRHFYDLQGLRLWAPLGLILIALGTMGWGSALILAGTLDHRQLVQALGHAPA